MLLEAWRSFEAGCTSRPAEERQKAVAAVQAKMPRRVKRKRAILLDDGSSTGGMEEYYDYIFPVRGREGGIGRERGVPHTGSLCCAECSKVVGRDSTRAAQGGGCQQAR